MRHGGIMLRTLSILLLFLVCLVSMTFEGQSEEISTQTDKVLVAFNGNIVQPSFGTKAGSWFYYDKKNGSQLLLLGFPKCGIEQKPNYRLVSDLSSNTEATLFIPFGSESNIIATKCLARNLGNVDIEICWHNSKDSMTKIKPNQECWVEATLGSGLISTSLRIKSPCFNLGDKPLSSCAVEITDFTYELAPTINSLSLEPKRKEQSFNPIETSPEFRPTLARALIEWDWRMQDGIGTEREPRTFLQALELRLSQGQELLNDLQKTFEDSSYESLLPFDETISEKFEEFGDRLESYQIEWQELSNEFITLKELDCVEESVAEKLWKRVHLLKRSLLLDSPYFQFNSLVFLKHAPTVMSHQLTQVYGYCARPGGGIYILEKSSNDSFSLMKLKDITPSNLPLGSYITPELSYDANELYFSYCETPTTPKIWRDPETMNRRFHLYKMALETTKEANIAIKLTEGDFDDFSPLLLPDGDLIFCSTRRGGFHRCGAGPCYVYTLARVKGDGSNPHPISFHETNEWFPTLAHSGRIIYTRWDYVDRDAVYYQQLWSTRQDGTDVSIFYGNNTFNPPGMWEPKAIPGSNKILAIAGPHHGMSAGSVVRVDITKGVDDSGPITRLTPDVRFPEGEAPLPLVPQLPELCDFDYVPVNYWAANRNAERLDQTTGEKRWPVHCFKSPFPLADNYFIASYSYDQLLGEAGPNIPNQFGIYYCDAYGNRELVYRDPNISSLWAMPIRSRPVPPTVASILDEERQKDDLPTGTFFLQNVYESWPYEIPTRIKSLRIVQVLPKTTPNANQPMLGVANASPGKQVLGTVPVEVDGSAFFEAPARIPLLFQALDENGRMVQGMRSLVYLQPGETAGCTGCHEDRMQTVTGMKTLASTRMPSKIIPGPKGSNPLSYPILVQPILDNKCVACHNQSKSEGNIILTGDIDGHYTRSYNALINYVPITYWGAPEGNHEPRTEPNIFGSRPSKLTRLLEQGHHDVTLNENEWERFNVWQDANALFYGTFNEEEQRKQQKGYLIDGPELE